MKKLLIATAAMAVVAGAQAQSSVTIYGTIDASIGNTSSTTNAGVKTNDTAQTTGVGKSLATSVIGLKGSEDLGGGLKAEFQLEGHLDPSTGQVGSNVGRSDADANNERNATMFSRQAWVGLTSAKLGSIKFGRTADVVDSVEGYSNFNQVFDTEKAEASGIGGKNQNTTRYDSPVIGGVQFAASYSNGVSSTPATSTSATVLDTQVTTYGVSYTTGALTLGAAAGTATNASERDSKVATYYAGYNFGFADVRAQYTVDTLSTTSAGLTSATDTEVKTKELSASIPVPALGSGVSIVLHGEHADSTAANADYKQYGIVAKKDLSKRTAVYAGYRTKNIDNGTDTKFSVAGLVHSF